MPKMKTHSGTAKRFKKTAGGYKMRRANRNHILTKNSPKVKRARRANVLVGASDAPGIERLLREK